MFFVRRRKLDFWYMADAMIPSVPLGQAIGDGATFLTVKPSADSATVFSP